MPNMQSIVQQRLSLFQHGFEPIPTEGKRPVLPKWQSIEITEEWLKSPRIARSHRMCNTGIRTGRVLAVDIDIDRDAFPDLYDKVEELLWSVTGGSDFLRLGNPKRGMYIYRAPDGEEGVGKFNSGKWEAESGDTAQVEILGKGSQFVAYGEHPDGYEYTWPHEKLTDVDALPVMTAEHRVTFLDQVLALFEDSGLEKKSHITLGEGFSTICDLQPDTEFQTVDGETLTVADMQRMLQHGTQEFRVCMSPIRHGADNPGAGQASLHNDGTIMITDYAAELVHRLDTVTLMRETLGTTPPPTRDDTPHWRQLSDELNGAEVETDAELVDIEARRWVAVSSDKTFHRIDIPTPLALDQTGLNMEYPRRIRLGQNGSPRKMGTIIGERAIKASRAAFCPDKPWMWQEGGVWVLNTYRAPHHPAPAAMVPGGLQSYYDLLDRVCDDKQDRDWVERWWAYKVQHPGARGPVVLSIAAGMEGQMQGTGRGTMGKLMRRLLGHDYAIEVPFSMVAGSTYQAQYTEWLDQSLMVMVSEAMDTSPEHLTRRNARVSAYERIKELAEPGESRQMSIRKGKTNTNVSVHATFFLATNHATVMEIPDNDRRVYVVKSRPAREVDDAFWARIHAALDNPDFISLVYRHLKALDTGAYSPHAPVPASTAKRLLLDRMQSREGISYNDFLTWLPGDLVDSTRLGDLVLRYCRENNVDYDDTSVRLLGHMIRERGERLDPINPGYQVRVSSRQVRPWILRNADKWQAKIETDGPAAARRDLLKNHPEGTGISDALGDKK